MKFRLGKVTVLNQLRLTYKYRELLILWTFREVRARYKQSALGGLWAVLQPLVLMAVYSIVFTVFIHVPTKNVPYPIFSYTALLSWMFLANSITFAMPSLISNLNLITKVYFPREILPVAMVGAAFVDFVMACIPFVGMMVWYKMPVTANLLWVPLLVAIQTALALAVVIPAAALVVFYRDVRFIVPLGLQIWLYATPVIYPVSVVPEKFRLLYAINPMVGLVDSYRSVLLYTSTPNLLYLGISAVVTTVLLVTGYVFFKRSEAHFADVV